MRYFDYGKVAAEARIPPARLARLRSTVRRDFPQDDMMFEPHMLRLCTTIRDGPVPIDQALAEDPRQPPEPIFTGRSYGGPER
jgi:hypothetical protein